MNKLVAALQSSKILLVLFLCLPFINFAQTTSASIEGRISDTEGEDLLFVNVVLTHTPTATIYGTTSDENGRYVLDNLKSGGPYTLEVSYVGYEPIVQEGIYISIAQSTRLNLKMQASAINLSTVEVKYDKNSFDNNKEGVSHNIGEDLIQNTPSLNRSLQDVTRLVPQGGQSSFAGSNYRFNNLSIDGASNNDVLGFQEPASGSAGSVASNTPGALAGTQPISLDAIQEVQVAIAPFDVVQGNFTGANLNAVTKGGSNQLKGSAYFFGRNQVITGKSIDETRSTIADYHDYQAGLSIGAPIVKNKLFVFSNYEHTSRSEPVLNAPGSPGTQISADIAEQVSNTLAEKYGFDAGTFGDATNERISDKFFIRLDYNINDKHQLTLRDNYVKASSDNLERGANYLTFGSQGFTHHSKTNSLVAELKSKLSNNVYNHLIVGYNSVNDERTYDGEVFPHIQITYNSANTIFAGTYREASIYGLTLNTTQLTNNLKVYKGKHTLTFGTNNDIYNIEYRFLTAWNGRWEYKTLDDFFNDRPKRIRGVYNLTNNDFEFNKNNPSADFRVMLLSLYAQDKYRFNDRLTATAGIRLDMQVHPDKVPLNPAVVNTPEFSHFDNEFGGIPQINPRASFQYLLDDAGKAKLRGGSGLFSGRIPFAWYAYSHYISGLNYGNIDLRPSEELPLTRDLSTLREQQPNLTEINLIDNDFKLPRAWKSSLAIDLKLPAGIEFTLEGLYTKAITDILFKSINLKDSTAQLAGADDRSYYLGSGADKKINPDFTNVFLLTNTDEGYKYFITASARKSFAQQLEVFGAYTYGQSKDVTNGVRNSMAANFNWNQAVNSNEADLSWSNFDIRHRLVASLRFQHQFNDKHASSVNLIYTANSGQPFSYTIAGDVNRDGSSQNDLFFVPASATDITLEPIMNSNGEVLVSSEEQWQQLDAYISNDEYLSGKRGEYTERNGGRAPWNHSLDLRLAHKINIKKNTIEINFDIINLANFIHYKWGHQTFVPNVQNSSYQLIDFNGINAEQQAVYQFNNPQGTPWQTDPLNSRWQAQLGLRYGF